MHTFLIAALTADGFIARLPAVASAKAGLPAGEASAHDNNRAQASTAWTSEEDTAFFKERTKQAGVVVMGSRTFRTIGKALPKRLTIVYSEKDLSCEGIEVTKKPPRELLADLEARGYKEVAICGGASVYTLFMEAGVVDTLYLTVEPVLFGSGVPLFTKPIEARLALASTRNLSDNVVLHEYKVDK